MCMFRLRVARIGTTEAIITTETLLLLRHTHCKYDPRAHGATWYTANLLYTCIYICFLDVPSIALHTTQLSPTTPCHFLSPILLFRRLATVITYVGQHLQTLYYSIQIKSTWTASLTKISEIAPTKPGKTWCLLSPNHDYTRNSPMGRRLCKKSCHISREKRL
jgi:hypothetical protein